MPVKTEPKVGQKVELFFQNEFGTAIIYGIIKEIKVSGCLVIEVTNFRYGWNKDYSLGTSGELREITGFWIDEKDRFINISEDKFVESLAENHPDKVSKFSHLSSCLKQNEGIRFE